MMDHCMLVIHDGFECTLRWYSNNITEEELCKLVKKDAGQRFVLTNFKKHKEVLASKTGYCLEYGNAYLVLVRDATHAAGHPSRH